MSISEPAEVQVEIGTYGLKKVVVNGNDLTESCKSIQITADSSSVPVVSLVIAPGPLEIEGPGVVYVQENGGSMRASVEKFLGNLDGAYLEGKSLENVDFGTSTGDAFINLLKEMASELP